MTTRAQFMRRAKIARLPPAERERRWKQHLASVQGGNARAAAAPSRSRPASASTRPARAPGAPTSECAQLYLEALLNPWETRVGACVPTFPALPSAKTKVFVRGNGATGTNGYGFVTLYDAALPCNNALAVNVTNGAYTGSTLAFAGTGVDAFSSNAPYATGDITADDVNYRVVAQGIRIRYNATELEMGGSVYAVESPSHTSVDGMSANDILQLNRTEQAQFNRDWVGVVWSPVKEEETRYRTAYASGGGSMGILIRAASSSSVTFEFEVFAHVEYVGAKVRQQTPSHTDASGFAKATQFAGQLHTRAIDRIANGAMGSLKTLAQQALRQITPEAVGRVALSASTAALRYGARAAIAL